MSVYIYLEPPFDYLVTDSNGRQKSKGRLDKLADFSKLKARGKKIGVVPGQCVSLRGVEIPTNNKARITSVLPNALEEEVIGDIDSLFFCLVGPNKEKTKHTLIVDRKLLDSWVSEAKGAGIQLDHILPDFALMPTHKTAACSLMFDQTGYVYVQHGYFNRKKIRREFVNLWLNSTFNSSIKPDASPTQSKSDRPKSDQSKPNTKKKDDHLISIACNDKAVVRRSGLVGAQLIDWSIGKHWRDWVGQSHRNALEFNLLDGEYTPAHRKNQYGGLKYALFFFLLAALVRVGSDGYEYVGLIKENTRLDREIRTVFSETFPQVKRIVNPRVQMLNKIAELKEGKRGGNEMLVILSLVSPIMQFSNVEFDSMEYRNGELVFVSLFGNFSLLDRFHQQLKNIGELDVTLGSSGSLDGKVSGRFVAKLK